MRHNNETLFADNVSAKSVIAHRGASAFAPENTLAAFRKAKELGAKWVECDVQLTKDGKAIIFHDSRLNRTTNGFGWVKRKTYTYLSTLDAGKGETIPTLEATLGCLDALSLNLHLEIKPAFSRIRQTSQTVMDILHNTPLKNTKIWVSSFSPHMLYAVRKLDATIPIGLALDHWNPFWKKHAERLSCVSIHCAKRLLTPKRIAAIKNTGRQVLAFTVNNREEAENLYQMGVDAVFSDYPNLCA